jgi:hypothetical protein
MKYNITKQPAWLDTLSDDSLSRLNRNNAILVEGSSDVVISPAMKNVEDSEIEEFVRSTFESGSYDEYLIGIEESNLSKLGPRSIATPWSERRDSLIAYFTDVPLIEREHFLEITSQFVSEFHLESRLNPVPLEIAVGNLEPSSSGGLPYMQKKGIIRKAGNATEDYVDVYPCVVYTRTQEGGKTRNVMAPGISDILRESRVFLAFLPIEKKLSWRAAIVSPDTVDVSMTRMLRSKTTSEVVFCSDFSTYDASVTPWVSGHAFAFIAGHFNRKHWDLIYDVYERFATIPFFTPEGEFSGNHGVPSGSMFTNTVDSIAQYLTTWNGGFRFGLDQAEIQGDDGVYIIEGERKDDLVRTFEDAGLVVNLDKSDVFEDQRAVYLQKYYNPRYTSANGNLGGVYSIARAILRLKYLERFIDDVGLEEEITGRDYFSLRAISILENCKHHPHFIDLIKQVRQWDKFALSYSKTSVRPFEDHDTRRSRTRNVKNQYGDESGIESFETVKVLRSL